MAGHYSDTVALNDRGDHARLVRYGNTLRERRQISGAVFSERGDAIAEQDAHDELFLLNKNKAQVSAAAPADADQQSVHAFIRPCGHYYYVPILSMSQLFAEIVRNRRGVATLIRRSSAMQTSGVSDITLEVISTTSVVMLL